MIASQNRTTFSSRSSKLSALRLPALLLAIVVAFYWKVLLTHQFSMLTGWEGVNQAYAWLNFLVSSLKQGSWPLWDPYTFSGHLFSGETQTGAFYPLYLLLAAFPLNRNGLFSPELYHFAFAVSHFLGAWFMFLLVRELKLGNFAGIVAAICFSLGGILAQLGEWPHLLNSGIWLPLIFLFLLRAIKAPTGGSALRYAASCGLALGMSILAGGIHVAIMQAIAIATAAAYFCLDSKSGIVEGRAPWRRGVSVIGAAALIAFTAGAVQLLSSAEYSRQAVLFVGATSVPASEKIPYRYLTTGLYAHSLFNMVIPAANGGKAGTGETLSPYLGVFPVLLAVIGIWRRWQQGVVRYLTGLIAAAFLYALGSVSLLHGLLYALTPYLWLAREATRFMYLWDFALAILAAYGLEVLFSGTDSLSRLLPTLKWIAVAALVALALPAIFAQLAPNPWVSLSLVLIIVSCLLVFYILGHRGAWARVLTVALILFDLSAFDWSATDRLELSARGQDQMERLLSLKGAAQFLKSRTGVFRAQVTAASPPNIGDVFQLPIIHGSGVTMIANYSDFLGRPDLLNVRYAIKRAETPDPGAIYQDAQWKVYENPNAYPRAWLVHETTLKPSQAAVFADLAAATADLHRVALLTGRLDQLLEPTPNSVIEEVSLDRYEANRLELTVHAGSQALLVLSEMFYPGWTAEVNGRPARIFRVDGLLRGIVVPAGSSHVSFQYKPVTIYVGGMLTLATFATALLSLIALGWARSRRPAR